MNIHVVGTLKIDLRVGRGELLWIWKLWGHPAWSSYMYMYVVYRLKGLFLWSQPVHQYALSPQHWLKENKIFKENSALNSWPLSIVPRRYNELYCACTNMIPLAIFMARPDVPGMAYCDMNRHRYYRDVYLVPFHSLSALWCILTVLISVMPVASKKRVI